MKHYFLLVLSFFYLSCSKNPLSTDPSGISGKDSLKIRNDLIFYLKNAGLMDHAQVENINL